MAEKFFPYDPADALDNLEAIEVFLVDAFATADAACIASAFGDVARSRGMNALAAQTGLSVAQLCSSLTNNGSPTLETTLLILKALGLSMTVAPGSSLLQKLPASNS